MPVTQSYIFETNFNVSKFLLKNIELFFNDFDVGYLLHTILVFFCPPIIVCIQKASEDGCSDSELVTGMCAPLVASPGICVCFSFRPLAHKLSSAFWSRQLLLLGGLQCFIKICSDSHSC